MGLPPSLGSRTARPIPAGWAAFLLATFVATIFAVRPLADMSSGGCDGGTCTLAYVAALFYFGITWAIVFPVTWALIRAMQRITGKDRRPPQSPPS